MGNSANEDEPLTEINVEVDTSDVALSIASSGVPAINTIEEAYTQNDPPTVTVTVQRPPVDGALPADTEPNTIEPRVGVHGLVTAAASPASKSVPTNVPSLASDDDDDEREEEHTSKTSEAAERPARASVPSLSSDDDYELDEQTGRTNDGAPSAALKAVVPAPRRVKSPTMQGLGPGIRPIVQTPIDPIRPIASSEVDLLARSPTTQKVKPKVLEQEESEGSVEPPTRFVFDPAQYSPAPKPKPARSAPPAAPPRASDPAISPAAAIATGRAVREDEETITRAEEIIAIADAAADAEDATVQRVVDEADLEETQMAPSDRMVAAAVAAEAQIENPVSTEDRPKALPEQEDTTSLDTSLLSGGVRLSEAVEEAANGAPTISDEDDGPTSSLRNPPVTTLPSHDLRTDPGSSPGSRVPIVPTTQPMPVTPVTEAQNPNRTLEMVRPAFVNQPRSAPRIAMELQETHPAFPPIPGSPEADEFGPRGTVKVKPGATGATPVSFGHPSRSPEAPKRRGGGFVFLVMTALVVAASVGFYVVRSVAPAESPVAGASNTAASESPPPEATIGPPTATSAPSASASSRVPPGMSGPIRRWPPPPPPPRPILRPPPTPPAPAPKPSAPLHI